LENWKSFVQNLKSKQVQLRCTDTPLGGSIQCLLRLDHGLRRKRISLLVFGTFEEFQYWSQDQDIPLFLDLSTQELVGVTVIMPRFSTAKKADSRLIISATK